MNEKQSGSSMNPLLREDPELDAERLAEQRETVTGFYGGALKKVERIGWIYIAASVAVAVVAITGFGKATGTKELIAYAVLFMLAIETQVLIKLWYWMMNTKLGLLRELKLMRLGSAEADLPRPGLTPAGGCSKRERWIWLVGIVVLAIVCAQLAGGIP